MCLGLPQLFQFDANSIAQVTAHSLRKRHISMDKIVHATSDGANVILGKNNGV